MWLSLFSCFLFSLAISFLVLVLGRKIGGMDAPDGELKRHERETPRIGGVGVAAGVAVGAGLLGYWKESEAVCYLLPYGFLLCVGLVDDLLRLPPFLKLAGQAAAFFAFYAFLPSPFTVFDVFLFVLGVFLVNAFNFMDGADGIAAGYAVPALLGLSVFFFFYENVPGLVLSLLLTAALLGFLPWNLPTAKLFMGDSGSLSVGFMLAALTVVAVKENPIAILFCLLPLCDALRVIIVRIVKKKKPWLGDRGHLHHILLARGMPSRGLFLLYLFSSLVISFGTVALLLFTK